MLFYAFWDFGGGLTPARRLKFCLSKSQWQTGLAASMTVFDDGRTYSLPQSGNIVAPVGLDVCDGAHSLGVMKKGKSRASRGGWNPTLTSKSTTLGWGNRGMY